MSKKDQLERIADAIDGGGDYHQGKPDEVGYLTRIANYLEDNPSGGGGAFQINVTVSGTFPNLTSATANKTFQEVLDAYNAGKSIVVQVQFNGGSGPLIEAAPISYTSYMGGVFAWSVVPCLNSTAMIVKFSYSKNGLYFSKVNITVTQ